MGSEPLVGEIPRWVSPPCGAADGGNGTQTSTGWDMGIPTHWGGTVNGGTVGDRDIYRSPSEHGRIIHCKTSYHGLVSGGGAEARNGRIQAMLAEARPGYPGDKGGECSSGGGRGDRDRTIRGIERVG